MVNDRKQRTAANNRKPRTALNSSQHICFISIEAYATLKPGVAKMAGGAGFQVVQIGRQLRELGHTVSYVVGDFGQPFYDVVDGFPTYRASRVYGGWKLTRGPANVLRLLRAMLATRADHYVLRSIRPLSFFVLVLARMLGASYTFMIANLPHVTREEMEGMSRILRFLYAWSLRHADLVTVQSREQERLLLENFAVQGVLVPNGIAIPPFPEAMPVTSHDVAWASTVKPVKRPDRLLEIARALPARRFIVAGGPGSDHGYYDEMVTCFAREPNLTYAGFVPPDRVKDIYRAGRLFLLTSRFEGFPNTFLQAWALGIPVCALDIDPDGVVTEHGLGIVEADVQLLAGKIDALLNDREAYEAMRRRCHEYVRRYHSLERLRDAFLAALPVK